MVWHVLIKLNIYLPYDPTSVRLNKTEYYLLTIYKFWMTLLINWASLVAQRVNIMPAMQTGIWTPGWEDPLEEGMATHYSSLAWRIPWAEKPGRLQSKGSQRVRHDWENFTWSRWHLWNFIPNHFFKNHILYHKTSHLKGSYHKYYSQFSPSVASDSLWPVYYSTEGFSVHHQLPELTQTHIHQIGDAIQPSHPLSSLYSPAFNLSRHQGLFQGVSSLHQVAKVLKFQLQHRSFWWIFRIDFI